MFNWSEIEAVSRLRLEELSRFPSAADIARIEAATEDGSARKPMRSRIAATLVSLGERLDPDALLHVERSRHNALLDAQIAALR